MFFAISTPNTLTAKVGGPIGQTWYSLTGKLQDSLVIAWSVPDEPYLIQPGDSAVGFFHSAVGEPNITRYYVQGDILIPEETDSAGNPYGNALPIWRDSYKGWTIAVVPLMNMAAPNMAERLVVVTSRACGDPAFITSPTLCENPNSRPRRAEQAIVENNLRGACDHLEALITEVAALSDAVITPEGRSLLTIRALQFIRRHCTQ